jgi:ABC-type dipeptide/oligopeptide/nickel transport system permease component
MIRHLLRRLTGMGLVLLAVTFITFSALAAAPGDAAEAMVGDSASAEQMALLRQSLGLDGSLLVRYQRFLSDLVLHGDLGRSLISGRPVSQLLLERLPYTALLALSAISLAVLLGAPLGMAAALRAGTRLDTALMGGAALGLAVPAFWSSLLLMLLFSLRLRWLPVAGAGSLRHLVLPAVTLALPTAAIVARLIRASLLDTMHADFVRTAHAKGLAAQRVFGGHVLRNSLIPVVTILALQLGHLLGGAFVVETIFGWPGVGRLAVQSIFDRDTPVVLGATLTIAAIYLLINLAVDVAHSVLDPRVGQAAV